MLFGSHTAESLTTTKEGGAPESHTRVITELSFSWVVMGNSRREAKLLQPSPK